MISISRDLPYVSRKTLCDISRLCGVTGLLGKIQTTRLFCEERPFLGEVFVSLSRAIDAPSRKHWKVAGVSKDDARPTGLIISRTSTEIGEVKAFQRK